MSVGAGVFVKFIRDTKVHLESAQKIENGLPGGGTVDSQSHILQKGDQVTSETDEIKVALPSLREKLFREMMNGSRDHF